MLHLLFESSLPEVAIWEKKTGKGISIRDKRAQILQFASSGNATDGYRGCV